jgi:ATP-binding cassette subfamily B (MDR/TAP) protein 1
VSSDRAAGALVGRLSQDCTLIQALTGERASIVVGQVVVMVAGLGVAFSTSWELTLIVFIIVPLIAVPVAIQAKVVAKYAEQAANSTVDAGNRAAEVILNIRTILSFGLEAHTMEKFAEELALPMKQGIRKGVATGLGTGVAAGIVLFGAAFKYFVGGIFFDEGMVSFADIMRCVLVLIFMAFGMGSVSKDASDKAEAIIAARRVREVMVTESRIDAMASNEKAENGMSSMAVEGQVEFKNVVFCYPGRAQVPILQGLNLLAEPGQTLAIVGPSGCGKSTVVSLLERFYDPDSGQVLLDGVDIRTVPVRWLRSQIGIVSQEPVLFNGTICENIALGKEEASQEEVEAAGKLANAHGFIMQFPKGYATAVGEKGLQLSGGQKQRIAIARAVVRDPALLILDEATSALDTVSERVVQAALEELLSAKRRTTLIIAHRLSTIQNADRIVVLSNGTVAEAGCHSELIQIQGGLYRSLVAHCEAGEKVLADIKPDLVPSSMVGA